MTDFGPDQKLARRLATPYTRHIFLCTFGKCADADASQALWKHLKRRLREPGFEHVERTRASCLRICERGTVAVVYPEGTWYGNLDRDALDRVIEEHLRGGRPVEDFSFHSNPLPPPESDGQSI